jgi:hypothetical protein
VFCCGVDIVGPAHLRTLLESVPAYWAPMKKMLALRVGDVEESPSLAPTHLPTVGPCRAPAGRRSCAGGAGVDPGGVGGCGVGSGRGSDGACGPFLPSERRRAEPGALAILPRGQDPPPAAHRARRQRPAREAGTLLTPYCRPPHRSPNRATSLERSLLRAGGVGPDGCGDARSAAPAPPPRHPSAAGCRPIGPRAPGPGRGPVRVGGGLRALEPLGVRRGPRWNTCCTRTRATVSRARATASTSTRPAPAPTARRPRPRRPRRRARAEGGHALQRTERFLETHCGGRSGAEEPEHTQGHSATVVDPASCKA